MCEGRGEEKGEVGRKRAGYNGIGQGRSVNTEERAGRRIVKRKKRKRQDGVGQMRSVKEEDRMGRSVIVWARREAESKERRGEEMEMRWTGTENKGRYIRTEAHYERKFSLR